MHANRFRRYGDPLFVKRAPRLATPEESFAARTRREGECLVWTGSKSKKGYGGISAEGHQQLVHRWVYARAHGPIPDDMAVDHICHNPSCVEIAHLRLASRYENARYLSGARRESRTGIRGLRAIYGGSWEARVQTHGKCIRKQFPPDQKEAAIEWLINTRAELFGQFAGYPGHIQKETTR